MLDAASVKPARQRLHVHVRAQVVDVGGGTGFCTLGVVKHIDPKNVTLLDQ